jgi:hypothetical protein
MIHRKTLKPNALTQIDSGESRYIKIINCETDLKMIAYAANGGEVINTEVRSGFDVSLPEFQTIILQSEYPQKVEIWASKSRLGYEAPTKGGNSNTSGLIEHFGGTQKALPFERNRVAVTLYSDSEPFWYGGEGVNVENGIPVRAGVMQRIEGAGELHIAVDKSPNLEMSEFKGVLGNQVDGVDYGRRIGSEGVATGKAIYFSESLVGDTSDEQVLLRAAEDRVEKINPLKKRIVDIHVKDFEKDVVGVLYSDGKVEVYSVGVLIETIATLLYVYNWRRLSWNGFEWCGYASGQGWRGVSNPDDIIFSVASGYTIDACFFDEYTSKWLMVGGGGGKAAIMDITDFTGVFDSVDGMSKPYGELSARLSFVRVLKNDEYIVLNQRDGDSIIIDRKKSSVIKKAASTGAFLMLQSGLIYSVSKEGQDVSYDGGVSFIRTGNETYTPDVAAGGDGVFIGETFLLRAGVKDNRGLYTVRTYKVKAIKAKAFAKIRMLKEVV